jgi:mannose-6-phosphate isomerase
VDLLDGVLRHYDWGDHKALAEVLGHTPSGKPEAEYWLGAHPSAPAALGPDRRPLDEAVTGGPEALLGPAVVEQFGTVPFLLKLLGIAQPLSIQAHPSLDQARAGFAREDAAGLARDARNRNYRDPNHKPELICALSPIEAKCGFRTVAESQAVVAAFGDALAPVAELLAAPGTEAEVVAATVAGLLRLPPEEAEPLATAAAATAESLVADGGDLGPDPRAVEWTVRIAQAFPGDIGVVVALLLNHLTLEPGEAIFLPAGNLHAYLGGVGVELMANSDNVLRGGLTPKHVDVEELLSVVDWRPSTPQIQQPTSAVHDFQVPVPEFALTRLDAARGSIEQSFHPVGPEIVLVTDGAVALEADGASVEVGAGQAAFVAHQDGPYRLVDRGEGTTLAWRASVGGPETTAS